jgi:transposase
MLADAFMLTGGQVHDIVTAPAMIDGVEGDALIADKAYDSNAFRTQIAQAGMQAVIPSNRTRKIIIPHDRDLYKARDRIERCFKLPTLRQLASIDSTPASLPSSTSPPQ